MTTEPLLLNLKQAAALTGLSQRKLTLYMKQGKLKYLNVSEGSKLPRYRIQRESIEEFIKWKTKY